jgi:hypothetical protein
MLIAVINQSTMVSNANAATMCMAIQIQLDLQVLPAWNMKAATIQFYPDATKVPGYAWLVAIRDNSTVAGALGYHSEDNDKIDAFIFAEPVLSNGGAVMLYNAANPTQYTVSGTLSHEVIEMVGDRYANAFVVGTQTSQGNMYALELCDPVEAVNVPVSVSGVRISCSNFLFPSYFNIQATLPLNAPFDYLGRLTKPFSLDTGGYYLIATLTGEGQVSAKHIFDDAMPQWRRDMKTQKFARSGKRAE